MHIFYLGTLSGLVVKNPPAIAGAVGLIPGLGRAPGRKKWQPTPVFLPGKSHDFPEEPGRPQSMESPSVIHD